MSREGEISFFGKEIDWNLTDTSIARDLQKNGRFSAMSFSGIYSRVRAWRKRNNIPRSPNFHKRGWPSEVLARAKAWDWKLIDVRLAEIHGLTRERIRQIRKGLGLPPSNGRRGRTKKERAQAKQ